MTGNCSGSFLLTKHIDRLAAIFNEAEVTFKESEKMLTMLLMALFYQEKLRRKSSYMMLKLLQCMKYLLMKQSKLRKVFGIKC